MKKYYILFVSIFLTSSSYAQVEDPSCYQLFHLDSTMTIDTGISSVSCTRYEEERQKIYAETNFYSEIDQIDAQLDRIKSTINETQEILRNEKTDQNSAQVELIVSSINTMKQTIDPLDDCLRAVAAARTGNAWIILRKLKECIEEIEEAADAASDTIDKWDEHVTVSILRDSSEGLIAKLRDLKKKLIVSKNKHEANKSKFFEMCAVIKNQCFTNKVILN